MCESAGNLIIRAALTEAIMKPYLPLLWLFLSLSGPHLGYLCSANKIFCSGMWLFKKFTAGTHTHLHRPCFNAQLLQCGLSLFCQMITVVSLLPESSAALENAAVGRWLFKKFTSVIHYPCSDAHLLQCKLRLFCQMTTVVSLVPECSI